MIRIADEDRHFFYEKGAFMKEFTVNHTYSNGETDTWTGTVSVLHRSRFVAEAEIRGRGSSFSVIAGKYALDSLYFICIPFLGVAFDVYAWDDLDWNMKHLTRHMSETDAATVLAGVKFILTERTRKKKRGMER